MTENLETTATSPIEAEVNPSDYLYFTWDGAEYKVKKKFKRLKFLRLLGSDPVGALELAFEPDDFAELEDMDMDEEQLEDLLEITAKTLVGKSSE